MSHTTHPNHHHAHSADCGHLGVQHGDHVDYLHDGHLHFPHEGHYYEGLDWARERGKLQKICGRRWAATWSGRCGLREQRPCGRTARRPGHITSKAAW